MREATKAEVVIDASAAEVMNVIADIEAYPQWTAFKKAVVIERDSAGLPEVVEFSFDMGAFKDEQTMRYQWPGAGLVQWEVTASNLLKSLSGSYQVTQLPTSGAGEPGDASSPSRSRPQTRVVYELTMEVSMPLISAMRKRAERMIVDTALQGLKKRVEERT